MYWYYRELVWPNKARARLPTSSGILGPAPGTGTNAGIYYSTCLTPALTNTKYIASDKGSRAPMDFDCRSESSETTEN